MKLTAMTSSEPNLLHIRFELLAHRRLSGIQLGCFHRSARDIFIIQIGTEPGTMLSKSKKGQRLRSREDMITDLVKGERVSEYPNCCIHVHKRQRSAHHNSYTRSRFPVDRSFELASIFYPNLTGQPTRRQQTQWGRRGRTSA
jgi:hypothetical protein